MVDPPEIERNAILTLKDRVRDRIGLIVELRVAVSTLQPRLESGECEKGILQIAGAHQSQTKRGKASRPSVAEHCRDRSPGCKASYARRKTSASASNAVVEIEGAFERFGPRPRNASVANVSATTRSDGLISVSTRKPFGRILPNCFPKEAWTAARCSLARLWSSDRLRVGYYLAAQNKSQKLRAQIAGDARVVYQGDELPPPRPRFMYSRLQSTALEPRVTIRAFNSG